VILHEGLKPGGKTSLSPRHRVHRGVQRPKYYRSHLLQTKAQSNQVIYAVPREACHIKQKTLFTNSFTSSSSTFRVLNIQLHSGSFLSITSGGKSVLFRGRTTVLCEKALDVVRGRGEEYHRHECLALRTFIRSAQELCIRVSYSTSCPSVSPFFVIH
jgi:hypothetical protein